MAVPTPSPTPATLACERCTKLKVKCSKEHPSCSQCLRSGHQCVPVLRIRRPRGRNGGRPMNSSNKELVDRVNRLESLVKSIGQEEQNANATGNKEVARASAGSEPGGVSLGGTDSNALSTPQEDGADVAGEDQKRPSAPLGQTLFVQLSNALGGIREILDDGEVDVPLEPTTNGDTIMATPHYSYDTSRHLFSSLDSPPQHLPPIPTPDQTVYLLKVYRQRVNPIVKVVHMPTLEREIGSTLVRQGCWARDSQNAAAHAAVVYASVSSLNDAECRQAFGQAKSELQATWRSCVEHQIANSNFLVSERLETLQALVLYFVALRSHDASRTVWTLLPLAIRIAQALHLHREESFKTLDPLEGHVRRCIWHCLLLIDFQAAMDRGSDTIISERGSSTRPPLHIDDSQIDGDSVFPSSPVGHVTEMTFFSMECLCTAVVRSLNFVEPADMERAPSAIQYDWNARIELVSQLESRFESYLNLPDYSNQYTDYRNGLTKTIISAMRLYVVRPLQSHPAMKVPNVSEFNVLQLAKETLSAALEIYNENHVWSWYARQFNSWHPLAVLLAELAVTNDDVDAGATWALARQGYEELSRNIAEGVRGPLWLPITKLMRAAQKRQKLVAPNIDGGSEPFGLGMEFPELDVDMISEGSGFDQAWAYWEAFVDDVARMENLL